MNFSSWMRACVMVVAIATPSTFFAQEPTLSAADMRDLIEASVDSVMPDSFTPSRVPLSKRGVHVDLKRTMKAFRFVDEAIPPFAAMRFRGARVKEGTSAMLSKCPFEGLDRCDRLGWRVYVHLEPVDVTSSQVVVRAWFLWADRLNEAFVEGADPQSSGRLLGFFTELEFARDGQGALRFAKRRRTMIL